jgi:UDP-N-acetylmuramoylalanine--D-glutamate ligase
VAPISSGQVLGRGVSALNGKIIDARSGRSEVVADLAQAPALAGKHNAQNAAAAFAAGAALGIEARVIAHAFTTFPGLPHRLERVASIDGVRFINDSKATNANAAAQALAVYPRVYWIAGGVAKDGGIDELASFFPRMAKAYLIGQSAGEFSDGGEAGVQRCESVGRAASGGAVVAGVRVLRSIQIVRGSRRSIPQICACAQRSAAAA